jgi:hypothetical protein
MNFKKNARTKIENYKVRETKFEGNFFKKIENKI